MNRRIPLKILNQTIHQLTLPTPFAVGDVHVYLIKGDMLSLVDAGVKTKEAWESLTHQLKQLGYRPEDIEQLILTHHHPDHIGLIEEFPRLHHISAHKHVDLWLRRDEEYLQKYEHFFRSFYALTGVPSRFDYVFKHMRKPLNYSGQGVVTNPLREGDLIPGHDQWQVINTKGHAQTHLSLFSERDGGFIGGDHLLANTSPNPLLEAPYGNNVDREKPLLQYRANLRKCLSLGIHTVYPGHGDPFTNPETLIHRRLKRQEYYANKVYQLLVDKPMTPFKVCQQLFPKQYKKQLELTMSETIGQLDLLEEQGRVDPKIENELLVYHAV